MHRGRESTFTRLTPACWNVVERTAVDRSEYISRAMPDCVIIGIGNLIKKDDGVGVHVVRGLAGRVPPGVELIEGSVYCADLHGSIEGCDRAIFIDGIDAGEEPGAVFRFTPDEVRGRGASASMSIHDFGLYDLIATARLMDQCPEEITIFAVQVKDVDLGMEMSPEVAVAVEKVCLLVLEELGGGARCSAP